MRFFGEISPLEIDAASLEHLESRRFIDMYRGKQVGQGRKSMTFSLTFRAADRTLTHEEIDQSVENWLADWVRSFRQNCEADQITQVWTSRLIVVDEVYPNSWSSSMNPSSISASSINRASSDPKR